MLREYPPSKREGSRNDKWNARLKVLTTTEKKKSVGKVPTGEKARYNLREQRVHKNSAHIIPAMMRESRV